MELTSASSLERGTSGARIVRDLAVPLVFVALVGLFLVPIPAFVLDFLLVTNIVLSLALLLRSVISGRRSDLFAFPSLLLVSTLFRLGLNVSSTRLILLHGEQGTAVAGRVIETFGTFIAGGDFVVGAIVFTVIAIVNFIVITRGSARVAEVSARFSLDALPGRQLAIDADQRNSGLSASEADERREDLNRESQFFGSMDGAMRFVQGDAIACLVIVAVNALGGMFLGVSRGLGFGEAVETFGVLAIGDGLVSIIPSLLISVTAGIVVTNGTGRGERRPVGDTLPELFSDPRALALAGIVIFLAGFLRGFPIVPFAMVGLALVIAGVWQSGTLPGVRSARGALGALGGVLRQPDTAPEARADAIGFVPLRLELSAAATGGLVSDTFAPEFQAVYRRKREDLFRRRGVLLPTASVSRSPDLRPGEYRVFVRERTVRAGELPDGGVFVPLSRAALTAFGLDVVGAASHPLTPQAAVWVREDGNTLEVLQELEVELLRKSEFLALEVIGAALSVVEELFGVDEVKLRVEELRRELPHLAGEVIEGKLISVPELAELTRALVRERVSVRDFRLIFEGIAEYSCRAADIKDRAAWREGLHAHVRGTLSRAILDDSCAVRGVLRAFILSPEVEEGFRDAVAVWTGAPDRVPLEPAIEEQFRRNVHRMFRPVVERGALPVVVLCSGEVRAGVHEALRSYEFQGEWYTTIAFEELGSRARTETVGVISL